MDPQDTFLIGVFKNRPGLRLVPLTLVYLVVDQKVLLIHRDESRIFANQWLGLGGKVESREDVITAAVREVREECGLTILNPVLRGNLVILDETDEVRFVYIVVATEYSGRIHYQSVEGSLEWHPVSGLEQMQQMVANQHLFLGRILADPAYYYYGMLLLRKGKLQAHISSDSYFQNRDDTQ